jgi:CheY-like chemotaxis protein
VLLDLVMPEMSGRDLLERVRELRPEVPVLLTSGYSEEPSKDRPRAQAQAFLRKPYRQAELGRALVEAIRLGRTERAPD